MDREATVENSSFGEIARAFYEKYDLTTTVPKIDLVITTAREFSAQHNVPEKFWQDEINLALILGCAQRMVESTDPYYKSRVENLAKRLIVKSVPKKTFDEEELWGKTPDRAGLGEEQLKEYIREKTDPKASAEFIEKHKILIEECKAVWKEKGYDLQVNVAIVDDTVANFGRITGAMGWIKPPDRDELEQAESPPVVELVLLKGKSAEEEEYIKHELYHIKDFFGLTRRGYQSGIFELLDELHTEYMAGNYRDEHSKDPFSGINAYFTAKEFWDRISFLGDLDFHLLTDRPQLLDTVIRNFGCEGLVEFALLYAHSGGKIKVFETFYNTSERPAMAMLVAKEKLRLLKEQSGGNAQIDTERIVEDVNRLAEYLTPIEKEWEKPRYKSLYDLLPSRFGSFYAAREIDHFGISTTADNEILKGLILSYARALALAELSSDQKTIITDEEYQKINDSLAHMPYQRRDKAHSSIAQKENLGIKTEDIVKSLFVHLVNEVQPIELAFNLQNQAVRERILQQFFDQLNPLAEYVLDHEDKQFPELFVDGIYGHDLPFEVREAAATYLSDKFPQLKPIIEAKRKSFDSRNIASRG